MSLVSCRFAMCWYIFKNIIYIYIILIINKYIFKKRLKTALLIAKRQETRDISTVKK